jgi:hypothetical protein
MVTLALLPGAPVVVDSTVSTLAGPAAPGGPGTVLSAPGGPAGPGTVLSAPGIPCSPCSPCGPLMLPSWSQLPIGVPMCAFEGCDHPVRKTGLLCSAHYRQKMRGIPLAALPDRSINTRLNRSLEKIGNCLIWTGTKMSKGPGRKAYGRFDIGGERFLVHRVAYEQAKGPIADDMILHHLCDNVLCCNVNHLQLMTRGEHTRFHNQLRTQANPE